MSQGARRVVYVAGSGRSGTSTLAGALRTLGLHVPQPEVAADVTNPKGFGEPAWVVELHTQLLARSGVQVSDARPGAWLDAGRVAADHAVRLRIQEFLAEQFEVCDELVIKDPRAAWFLGAWRAAADWQDARSAYVTMLRPVTEVVGSKQRYYDDKPGAITRTAAWINMMLGTEISTRGHTRAFVRYEDLLSDWTVPLFALGEQFDLAQVKTAMAADIAAVHDFIDPGLRRVRLTWDDVPVPPRLRELADETWRALDQLAVEGGDNPETHETCDQLRASYADDYAEAEAYAASSILAARRAGAREARSQSADSAASSRAELVPHAVRSLVPEGARRGLRKALGRERD